MYTHSQYVGGWHESVVYKIPKEKKVRPEPSQISDDRLEPLLSTAKHAGIKVTYRNRKGKQYVTLTWTPDSLNDQWYSSVVGVIEKREDRLLMTECGFDESRQTSGGYSSNGSGNTTWRLNP